MALRVSTVSSTVYINDLGLVLEHPTVDRDLSLEFTSDEIKNSSDLTTAIQDEDLTVDDGQFLIRATDYNPNEIVNQELDLKVDQRFISHTELGAGYLDTPIEESTFPLDLNSTASSTKNVYAVGARWGTWQIDTGDFVVITGSSAADGTYTVDEIIDHQNFLVNESIPDSTGGLLTVYHPPASNNVGVNPTPLTFTNSSILQEVLEEMAIAFDPNTQVITTEGALVYIDEGNIVLVPFPIPKTAFDDY